MCIIIDTCSFSSVFNSSDSKHLEFKPVLDWLINGKGKIVYGGSKYKNELKNASRYIRLFLQLKKAGKTIEYNCEKIDKVEQILIKKNSNLDFDDPHLVAIVICTGCLLICTSDIRSHKFLKDNTIYPKSIKKPKIYSGVKNKGLLINKNIASICEPLLNGSRALRDAFKKPIF